MVYTIKILHAKIKNKLIFLTIFIIFIIFILRKKIADSLFYIHLYLNKNIRYAYIDDKKSKTGYWSSQQRETHVTCNELKLYLLNYYKKHNVKKVLDLGCGKGEYIKFLKKYNINAIGVDNCDICKDIEIHDLTKPYYNHSDYVQTFEVGEHIPKKYESIFIQNICNNAQKGIIMSWALPGQGGDGHINEKSTNYIIKEIEKYGFKLNKEKTNEIRQNINISPTFIYFRHNLLIFDKVL